ncbi:MAG TPA: AMP-binding protein [Candidatus Acidoferrum sp.]|nr:AMP-binding protein [Candidatus Acidoferrum sp.]
MASEFPTRPAIAAQQLAQLRRLLAAILPANRFYRQKLAGLDTGLSCLDDFRRFPFTTKAELSADQRAFPPYGTNLTCPVSACTRFHQTSGTTSTPLRWLDSPESWQSMVESWKKIYRAAGVQAGDRVYFAFSFGPFIGFWLAFDAAQQLGCLCLPGGGLSSAGRLKAIIDNSAGVLCCTPSYAVRLAEVAAAEKVDLRASPVRTIIVAGEPGGSIPATRRQLEQLWPGARVFDHHGMTETGPISHQCPAQAGVLHVIESAYLPEVVDPAGNPVPPGEIGELVVTTLERLASPLLRYRTGDLVRAAAPHNGHPPAPPGSLAAPCVCGAHDLALSGGILGRADDMLIVRGVNIFPSAVEDLLRGFAEIVEYQVAVDKSNGLPELSLRIELTADCPDAKTIVHRIQTSLHTAFNLRVPISLAPAGGLPRFEMKASRWIVSNRPPRCEPASA